LVKNLARRAIFKDLLFRCEWPFFIASDPAVDAGDIRSLPLAHGRLPSAIMPWIESRLRYLDHIEGRRVHLFRVACEHNLEEVEAGERSNLSDRCTTSWAKMKNPSDSGNGSF
jgi:hypothetical protein